MSLRINQNAAAMNAHRNLAATDTRLSQSIERLSSGYKINNASDDPSGLVNSENLRAQIGGLGQAISNSQDAVNVVKTAEGALTEVHSLLRSMRDLAVHAANTGANSPEAIQADQAQISSALESLNRISSTTSFGSKKLLDGTASIGIGPVTAGGNGANTDITSVKAASTNSSFANAIGNKAISVAVTQNASQAKATGAATLGAGAQLGTASNWTSTTTSHIKVNGVDLGTFGATQTVDDVVNAVNNNATLSQSVVATRTGGHIELKSKDYGSSAGITVEETLQDTGASAGTADNLIATGSVDLSDNAAHGTTSVAWGTDIKGTVTGNGVGGGNVDFNSGSGFTMRNAAGDEINFSSAMVGTSGGSATYASNVTGSGTVFQIGANAGDTATVNFSGTQASNLGAGASSVFANLSNIDVTSNAGEAIKVIDKAIGQISKQRADLGAFQKNVLESNMNSLSVTKENVSASESSIRDADMAAEMVEFTRNNILEQAGTSMLSQANQSPQQLLSLLR